MKVFLGLGNPGNAYTHTRHNIGWLVLDEIAESLGISTSEFKGKAEYSLASGVFKGEKILLVKPLTFMNNSGQAAAQVRQFFKVEVQDFLVILDDISLEYGKLRFRPKGSPGGHNGLKSIEAHLGTEYSRLRIGIKGQHPVGDLANYVLANFSSEEKKHLKNICQQCAKASLDWVQLGTDAVMNTWNSKVLLPILDEK